MKSSENFLSTSTLELVSPNDYASKTVERDQKKLTLRAFSIEAISARLNAEDFVKELRTKLEAIKNASGRVM